VREEWKHAAWWAHGSHHIMMAVMMALRDLETNSYGRGDAASTVLYPIARS